MRILKHLIGLNLLVFNLFGQTKFNNSSMLNLCETNNWRSSIEHTSIECLNIESKVFFQIVANNKEILLVNSKTNKIVEKIKFSIISTRNSSPLEKERWHWIKFKTPISPNLIAYSKIIETPPHYFIPIYANNRISAYMVVFFNTNNNSMSACN